MIHSLDSTAASTAESSSSMSPTPTPATATVKSEQSSPILSTTTTTTTTSTMAAPIIPSSSQKSAPRRRTKGGPVDPSVDTTPIPTHTTQFASHVPQPIHPLSTSASSFGGMTSSATTTPLESIKNPFESTTPTPQQQHQFQHSVVLPSQQQQHFQKYPQHHSLATPTSATVPTPPLPLPSSHHQYLQQQQAEFNGGSHGAGLGLGLGLNLDFYDFMHPMPMPPSSASVSSPSLSSSPPTPASAHTVTSATTHQSPVTTPSPIPKTSPVGGNDMSNGVGLYANNGSVLRNDDSSSSASSPTMLDLTGMASGLVDAVAVAVVVASQNPTSNALKRNSSHLVSSSSGSNKLFTSRGSFSNSSQGNTSSVQTSPDLDAAHSAPLPSSNRFDRHRHHPHDGLLQDVDMDFEHDDQTNTSTANDDDDQDRDDEDDDSDDPENNRPAICPHCLKEFQSKGLLRSHIVSHSSDRPFVCRDCSDKSYKRNHDLLRHRREKHNVEGAVVPPRGSGRHSHSGVSGGAKRGSGIAMGMGGGGDLAMMGGLVGFVGGAGGVRNRNHRRSCSSAILGSGLGTRSTTTSSPFPHQGMGMGLPDGYATAVTVISQNPHQHHHQQQQQNKMPSPHDLMFASPAAAGMMYLNTTLTSNGSGAPGSSGNGLDFPHLTSVGGSALPTPSFTVPSQKQQLHQQQQPFGHPFQAPMHQQHLHHMQGRRPPPPPLPQQLQQHHQIHPLQQHPLSMQHAMMQQQSQQQQHQRVATQQHLGMNLGLSLGLGLEMSDFGLATASATTAFIDQQRRVSSGSGRNSISSQGGIPASTSTPSLSSTYLTTSSSSFSLASQASSSSPSSEMMTNGIPMLASQ
ncbi:hypothetical protein BGW39_009486 [Mortierella sp. 14UC]|nr:hypothetical protein BGW39_009486 [Mortierella sp. 14UC]